MHTALVLAGRRGSAADPLAPVAGGRHRALLDVAGVPMLVRVLRALRASSAIGLIHVSIDEPEVLAEEAEIATWIHSGDVVAHRAGPSPSGSVLDVLAGPAKGEPVLVTTADHALLDARMVDFFARASEAGDADVLVGVVSASVVRAAHPDTTRTWIPLRGEAWSGANLFAFRTERALEAARFWRRAEQFRKRPWRLVSVFGAGTLLRFALRRLDLAEAFARASVAIGARVEPVALPFAEAAIDVDRPADLELVRRLLAQR